MLASFDRQAAVYDRRKGLPEEAAREVARASLALAEVAPGELVLELGAGTGAIGAWLAALGARYVGLDVAGGMLAVFRQRARPEGAEGRASLVQADADRGWPVEPGCARLVFSSRALHLLDADRFVRELFRAAAPGRATLLLGRVRRERSSVKERMRDEMRQWLERHGYRPREGAGVQRRVLAACAELGALRLGPVEAARWWVASTPRASIESWAAKQDLAGIELPPPVKARCLDELVARATEIFDDLDRVLESEEVYVLEGARLPGQRGSAGT